MPAGSCSTTMAGGCSREPDVIGIALLALVTTIGAVQPASAINREDADKLTVLMRASAKGDLKAVNALLTKGADPNAQSSQQGITALMCASYFGHLDVVK